MVRYPKAFSHIGITVSDLNKAVKFYEEVMAWYIIMKPSEVVEGLAGKIVECGGKQRMIIREYYLEDKPYKMVHMEDPFGNIIEIYSHSYELHYGSGAYQHELNK
ncbi:MAG: hypothetical protein WBG30_00800 [Psychrilyobacter sp.]|uniref:hypothetical protein n=1 Tax=Psychrilyobacter sp. TaxID=2586924 RepID=UPI003C714CD5